MSAENPEPPNKSQHPTLPGFDIHPGDRRVISDYMGVAMPPEDAAKYATGEDFDSDDPEPVVEARPEGVNLVEQKKDETVTALDKLRIIEKEYGFLPQTREELNEIWRLRKYKDTFSGSAWDLSVLLWHQSDATKVQTDDPEALLRKKVHLWGGFFRNTVRNKTLIKDVGEFGARYPNESSTDVMIRYKKIVSYAEPALMPVKATGVLHELAAKDGVAGEIAKNPFEYIESGWGAGLKNMSRDKLREIMLQTYEMNDHRHDFWYSALERARRHDVVKKMIADYIGPERPPDR